MNRNVTAIYRTYDVADLVRQRINDLSLSPSHIRIIPDRDEAVDAGGYRGDQSHMDALHDLDLPDEDLRTYQQSVRRGDYVISVEVDESDVARVQEIMRRPETETYDFDTRSAEFQNEELIAYGAADRATIDENQRGMRDTDYNDPYTRTYRRNAPHGGGTVE